MRIKKYLWLQIRNVYNPLVRILSRSRGAPAGSVELREIKNRARLDTDIADHLTTLFAESVSVRPHLIVELGVRGGESTFVFERVARLFDSKLVSVDLEDCQQASTSKGWFFVRSDDIEFAKTFEPFCRQKGFAPLIDILFIDTSHFFDHTVQEIKYWFPFLSTHAKVFFHDTNMKEVFFRKNGSIRFGWNNQRGVIRAIEAYLKASFCEDEDFIDLRDGWLIKHFACSSGLTVLERVQNG